MSLRQNRCVLGKLANTGVQPTLLAVLSGWLTPTLGRTQSGESYEELSNRIGNFSR
jgi:hypothetical protein